MPALEPLGGGQIGDRRSADSRVGEQLRPEEDLVWWAFGRLDEFFEIDNRVVRLLARNHRPMPIRGDVQTRCCMRKRPAHLRNAIARVRVPRM